MDPGYRRDDDVDGVTGAEGKGPFAPLSLPSATASARPRPMDTTTATGLAAEIARRRTFAIISHPDAGKTTLTEKLLLFGGAIQLAGEQQQLLGQRRLAGVRVRDDREG